MHMEIFHGNNNKIEIFGIDLAEHWILDALQAVKSQNIIWYSWFSPEYAAKISAVFVYRICMRMKEMALLECDGERWFSHNAQWPILIEYYNLRCFGMCQQAATVIKLNEKLSIVKHIFLFCLFYYFHHSMFLLQIHSGSCVYLLKIHKNSQNYVICLCRHLECKQINRHTL